MRSVYIAEVRVDQNIKFVNMFLRTANTKLAERELRTRYAWANQVELKALVPNIAFVRPAVAPIAFA